MLGTPLFSMLIWAAARQNQQMACAPSDDSDQRASAQSDQSLRYALNER